MLCLKVLFLLSIFFPVLPVFLLPVLLVAMTVNKVYTLFDGNLCKDGLFKLIGTLSQSSHLLYSQE